MLASAASQRYRRALLLLTLLLLLRCVLDTWDIGYYLLPFVFALLSGRRCPVERLPLLAALASFCGWFGFQWLSGQVSPPMLKRRCSCCSRWRRCQRRGKAVCAKRSMVVSSPADTSTSLRGRGQTSLARPAR